MPTTMLPHVLLCLSLSLTLTWLGCAAEPGCPAGTSPVGDQCSRSSASTASDAGDRDAGSADASTAFPEAGSGPCVPRDETCNGADDDCDGQTDEEVLTDYYLDQDRDGFGAGAPVSSCSPPSAQHTTQAGDCDDLCVTCLPGGAETVCDGRDNDCDASVDEDLEYVFYRDADGDGYGDAKLAIRACTAITGYVANMSDCDDTCAGCNPGKTADTTCDGKDDDCSGKVDDGASFYTYYPDCDGDTFAASSAGALLSCATPTPVEGCGWTRTKPTSVSTDCNDKYASVKPGQTSSFTTKIPGARSSVDFDYDCDGKETPSAVTVCPSNSCSSSLCVSGALPSCGERFQLSRVVFSTFGCRPLPSGTWSVRTCR